MVELAVMPSGTLPLRPTRMTSSKYATFLPPPRLVSVFEKVRLALAEELKENWRLFMEETRVVVELVDIVKIEDDWKMEAEEDTKESGRWWENTERERVERGIDGETYLLPLDALTDEAEESTRPRDGGEDAVVGTGDDDDRENVEENRKTKGRNLKRKTTQTRTPIATKKTKSTSRTKSRISLVEEEAGGSGEGAPSAGLSVKDGKDVGTGPKDDSVDASCDGADMVDDNADSGNDDNDDADYVPDLKPNRKPASLKRKRNSNRLLVPKTERRKKGKKSVDLPQEQTPTSPSQLTVKKSFGCPSCEEVFDKESAYR